MNPCCQLLAHKDLFSRTDATDVWIGNLFYDRKANLLQIVLYVVGSVDDANGLAIELIEKIRNSHMSSLILSTDFQVQTVEFARMINPCRVMDFFEYLDASGCDDGVFYGAMDSVYSEFTRETQIVEIRVKWDGDPKANTGEKDHGCRDEK